MGASLDVAKNRLYGEGSLGVSDIKLFPGTERDATPAEFSAEILRIIAELEADTVSEAGETS